MVFSLPRDHLKSEESTKSKLHLACQPSQSLSRQQPGSRHRLRHSIHPLRSPGIHRRRANRKHLRHREQRHWGPLLVNTTLRNTSEVKIGPNATGEFEATHIFVGGHGGVLTATGNVSFDGFSFDDVIGFDPYTSPNGSTALLLLSSLALLRRRRS